MPRADARRVRLGDEESLLAHRPGAVRREEGGPRARRREVVLADDAGIQLRLGREVLVGGDEVEVLREVEVVHSRAHRVDAGRDELVGRGVVAHDADLPLDVLGRALGVEAPPGEVVLRHVVAVGDPQLVDVGEPVRPVREVPGVVDDVDRAVPGEQPALEVGEDVRVVRHLVAGLVVDLVADDGGVVGVLRDDRADDALGVLAEHRVRGVGLLSRPPGRRLARAELARDLRVRDHQPRRDRVGGRAEDDIDPHPVSGVERRPEPLELELAVSRFPGAPDRFADPDETEARLFHQAQVLVDPVDVEVLGVVGRPEEHPVADPVPRRLGHNPLLREPGRGPGRLNCLRKQLRCQVSVRNRRRAACEREHGSVRGMTTRIGMIGTGWMGDAIAPDAALCDEVELVAVAGRDPARTASFAQRYGIPHPVDVDGLLGRDDVDLVYVATTHESHLELALAALAAGKPVLVEKPLTVDAAEGEQLVAAARTAGLFAMEAMWMRFNPAVRRLTELLVAGEIGSPRTALATFGFPVPLGGRLWDPARAGGSLLDQGVYPLTFADLVHGEPATIAATGSRLGYAGSDTGVDTEVGMLLGYADGGQSVLASSIRATLPLTASVGGELGRIELDAPFWGTAGLTVHGPDGSRRREEFPLEGNGYVPMLRAVDEALRHGWTEHPLCDHATTLRLLRTMDAVRRELGA
jgi:predicted dehydrogenase